MKEFLRKCLFHGYRLLPKRNHAVVWGWPDGEDNGRALLRELESCPLREVVLLMSDPSRAPGLFPAAGGRTRFLAKRSLRACWCFLTARYVFFTHRCFMHRFPPNVMSVNVWHGMPIKRIGWMLEGKEGIRSRHALATSPFWADIVEEALRPSDGALVTGLPRNDRLFSDLDEVRRKLGLAERDEVTRIVAWLPTFRRSVCGEIRHDGRDSGNAFGIDDADPVLLNDFLKTRNTLMWVKPHPMAPFDGPVEFSHLKIVDDSWLDDRGLSLYECLGACDVLVSDISSVVVDYLLLDRPIIHCFPDVEEYRESRGFSIEPVGNYFMGPVATTFPELLARLEAVLTGEDSEADRRAAMRRLFHRHTDAGSTRRLLEAIGLR